MNRAENRRIQWICAALLVIGLAADVLLCSAAAAENQMLRQRRDQALRNINEAKKEIAQLDEERMRLNQSLSCAKLLSGQSELAGEGLLITLSDAPIERQRPEEGFEAYLVHDVDVLNIINALRAGGTEAIAVNGTRITAESSVRCGGPTINVRRKRLTPPFLIRAIGGADRLKDALERDGLLDSLRTLGLSVQLSEQKDQRIEARKDRD